MRLLRNLLYLPYYLWLCLRLRLLRRQQDRLMVENARLRRKLAEMREEKS